MKKNSIERDIHLLESYAGMTHKMTDNQCRPKLDQAIEHLLSDYKKLQEEFKQVNHECERLEEKEIRLIKENEYYKDLINALETYYEITREDLEECIKNDK